MHLNWAIVKLWNDKITHQQMFVPPPRLLEYVSDTDSISNQMSSTCMVWWWWWWKECILRHLIFLKYSLAENLVSFRWNLVSLCSISKYPGCYSMLRPPWRYMTQKLHSAGLNRSSLCRTPLLCGTQLVQVNAPTSPIWSQVLRHQVVLYPCLVQDCFYMIKQQWVLHGFRPKQEYGEQHFSWVYPCRCYHCQRCKVGISDES